MQKEQEIEQTIREHPAVSKASQAYRRGDYITAARLLEPVANSGNSQALYTLGYMYYYGLGVNKDFKHAIRLISLAANKGHPKAIIALRKITDEKLAESPAANSPPAKQTLKIEPDKTPREKEPAKHLIETSAVPGTSIKAASIKTEPVYPTTPPTYIIDAPEVMPVEVDTEIPEKKINNSELAASTPEKKEHILHDLEYSDQQWILQQPDHYYTIQVLSGRNKNAVIKYRNKLKPGQGAYFPRYLKNQLWYSVVTGSFATIIDAKKYILQLQKMGIKNPWIRNMKSVKDIVRSKK